MLVGSRWFERFIYPLIVALNSVPKVAIAPLFVIWMGTGAEPKIAIAFLIAVFAIIVDTVHGLRSVPQDVLDLGRVLKGSRCDFFFKVRLPSALPSILAGMKVSISLALVGAIVGHVRHGAGVCRDLRAGADGHGAVRAAGVAGTPLDTVAAAPPGRRLRRRDQPADGPDRVLGDAAGRPGQRRQRHRAQVLPLQLQRLAGNAVVHVRRDVPADGGLHALEERPRARGHHRVAAVAPRPGGDRDLRRAVLFAAGLPLDHVPVLAGVHGFVPEQRAFVQLRRPDPLAGQAVDPRGFRAAGAGRRVAPDQMHRLPDGALPRPARTRGRQERRRGTGRRNRP
ncbi:hypothetical protein G6F35_011741 [Rhizopus arrhizus]|nr:hypothetical protein G6F35_011741 [Rhizopus arrhizus]